MSMTYANLDLKIFFIKRFHTHKKTIKQHCIIQNPTPKKKKKKNQTRFDIPLKRDA